MTENKVLPKLPCAAEPRPIHRDREIVIILQVPLLLSYRYFWYVTVKKPLHQKYADLHLALYLGVNKSLMNFVLLCNGIPVLII